MGTEFVPTFSFALFESVYENAPENAAYAVVRTDNDVQYASSQSRAADVKAEMQASSDAVSPNDHEVCILELSSLADRRSQDT